MPGPFTTPVAVSVPFDNSTNGFNSLETQSAIEEARAGAISVVRFTISAFFNATIGNNQWLGPSELGPNTNITIPVNCRIKEIAFAFNRTSVDGTFQLYINNRTTVVDSFVFSNVDNSAVWTNINQDVSAGQFVVGRWIDQGTNPNDMSIIWSFEVLP